MLARGPSIADFPLVAAGAAAPIYLDAATDPAIARAAGDLAADVERVSGVRPGLAKGKVPAGNAVVIVGALGRSPLIDRLAAEGRLDAGAIRGQWESDLIQVVDRPTEGIGRALVIAGSDSRGAIYGIYSVSEAIGVSPWCWWADVPPRRRSELWIAAGRHVQGPPAVKYRGIFLNDEDWGLRPWAAHTYDPSTGNIGPKTYARIFELLLRLRGNLLWPAMHPGTRAFNFYPEDKVLAGRYGIVMGSSHAEPMLRDNVDEWARDGRGPYDYTVNRAGVLDYWERRIRENARFENVYTVGMRGIHDDPMQGGGTPAEKAERLRRIIGDQRALLRKWVDPDLSRVPQIFCPYKEVLPLYRLDPGLVPDDVTLVWPDDNYGYIQHFSDSAERRRSGGAGVYYHVSYWGRPYDYLWLCSTPPALIGEEMTKAWASGARRLWVVNVGDLKPAEIDIEFFLRLAWNPRSWSPEDGQHAFLRSMASRDFGPEPAEEIASILDEYYRLDFQRRPEHMGVDPTNRMLSPPPAFTPFSPDEARARMASFAKLAARADALAKRIEPDRRNAYFELVQYPVDGAALANQRGLSLAAYYAAAAAGRQKAEAPLAEAAAAQAAIDAATAYYNDRVAGGKWRGMMSDTPRNLPVFRLPAAARLIRPQTEGEWHDDPPGVRLAGLPSGPASGKASESPPFQIVVVAADSSWRTATPLGRWQTIGGLGYAGRAVEVLPPTAAAAPDLARIRTGAPGLHYDLNLPAGGLWQVTVRRLPTWPVSAGGIRYAFAFDEEPPRLITCTRYSSENDRRWQRDVLRNASFSTIRVNLAAGRHVFHIWAVDPGLVLDSFLLSLGDRRNSYAWPTAPAGGS